MHHVLTNEAFTLAADGVDIFNRVRLLIREQGAMIKLVTTKPLEGVFNMLWLVW